MSVVSYQVEVSALGLSLVQRSTTDCGVPECDRETSKMRVPSTDIYTHLYKFKQFRRAPPSPNLTATVHFRELLSTNLSSTHTKTVGVQACITLSLICGKHFGMFRVTCVVKELILCTVYHVKFVIKFLMCWINICCTLVMQYKGNHDNCFNIKDTEKEKLFCLKIT